MELDTIRRKITALENRNQVNYASVAGNSTMISNNGASIAIDSKGDAICTNNIIADNVAEDNDDRLRECEWEIDHLDEKYAQKIHNHLISDVNMLQEELDDKADVDHEHEINMTLEIGKLAIKVNDDGKNADKYAPRTVYDYKLTGNIESPTTTAKVIANGGLQVNDVPVSMEGHNHDERYAAKSLEEDFANHNHDERYAVKSLEEDFANHNHDERYAMQYVEDKIQDYEEVYQIGISLGPNPPKSANINSANGLTVNHQPVSMHGHTHSEYATKDHTHTEFDTLKVNAINLEDNEGEICNITPMNIQLRSPYSGFINISSTGINFQDGTGYALEKHTHNTSEINNLKGYLIDLFYPVGSIYTSMNSTNPSTKFGGTWKQITDRFLYCAKKSKQTGGSKKISVDNLPPHTHDEMCSANPGTGEIGAGIRRTWYEDYPNLCSLPTGIKTGSTGSGTDYMPPYITVYAWYREA